MGDISHLLLAALQCVCCTADYCNVNAVPALMADVSQQCPGGSAFKFCLFCQHSRCFDGVICLSCQRVFIAGVLNRHHHMQIWLSLWVDWRRNLLEGDPKHHTHQCKDCGLQQYKMDVSQNPCDQLTSF